MSIKNLKSKKFLNCLDGIILVLLQNKDEDYSDCEGEGKNDLSPIVGHLHENQSESNCEK